MNLTELKNGEIAIIERVGSDTITTKRLVEMGFVRGREIKAIKSAPLKDPVEYEIMGYNISLRRSEAELIEVKLYNEKNSECNGNCFGGCYKQQVKDLRPCNSKSKTLNIALVGNPNCGKTTLYNSMAGQREHTGNYAGVTVGKKTATLTHKGYTINITDLPGIYSIGNSVAEERVVRDELASNHFDFVVNVVDSTLLERNLFLTTQLMDMGCHVIVSLNMHDELVAMGDKFDHEALSSMICIPMIPTVAREGKGTIEILDTIVAQHLRGENHTHIETNLGVIIEDYLKEVIKLIDKKDYLRGTTKRYAALMILDEIDEFTENLDKDTKEKCNKVRVKMCNEFGEDISQILANARYGYIAGALKETSTLKSGDRHPASRKIDNVLTHRIWGFPIFIAVLFVMFYSVFTLGAPLKELIEAGVFYLIVFLDSIMSAGIFKEILLEGAIAGVGSVIVFLPNILILFLFIALLEDSGYMARAAFIMDKLMHKIGLHGKSFIPMIMGFGCNVPAIMSTRIIEDKKNRLLTMLILPFMSCSARLPIYLLLVGTFFPSNGAIILLSLYLIGILVAILSSLVLRKTLLTSVDQPFVMELPPYRTPSARSALKHMWMKGSQYLRKMGGTILIGSMLIWGLSYYPNPKDSYLKNIGETIQPALAPLGFDWKISASLVSGVAAKEVVLSTMGVLNNEGNEENLSAHLLSATDENGNQLYTPAVALSLLVFCLLYFPCLAVIAAIKRESGSWWWSIFTMFYSTGVAWILSFITYRLFS